MSYELKRLSLLRSDSQTEVYVTSRAGRATKATASAVTRDDMLAELPVLRKPTLVRTVVE